MNDKTVSPRKVAILATDGFEQVELLQPKELLEQAGLKVEVLAPAKTAKPGEIKAWKFTDWGETVRVDRKVDDAKVEDYAALVLPGGQINPDKLRLETQAIDFIRSFGETGRPIAAICHGPWTLIDAGLAKGKRMTSWPSLRIDLTNAGAQWADAEVIVDGPIITSRKPDDIPAFVDALVKQLGAESKQKKAA